MTQATPLNENVKDSQIIESITPEEMDATKKSNILIFLQYLSIIFSLLFSIAGIYFFLNDRESLNDKRYLAVANSDIKIPANEPQEIITGSSLSGALLVIQSISGEDAIETDLKANPVKIISNSGNIFEAEGYYETARKNAILGDCFVDGNLSGEDKKKIQFLLDNYAKQGCYYSINDMHYSGVQQVPLLHSSGSALSIYYGGYYAELDKVPTKDNYTINDFFSYANNITFSSSLSTCLILTYGSREKKIPFSEKERKLNVGVFGGCDIIEDTVLDQWHNFISLVKGRGYQVVTTKIRGYNPYINRYETVKDGYSIIGERVIGGLNSYNKNGAIYIAIQKGGTLDIPLVLSEYFNPQKYTPDEYCIIEYPSYLLVSFEKCSLYDDGTGRKIELKSVRNNNIQ